MAANGSNTVGTSSSPPPPPPPPCLTKTMEEVWRDIKLSSLRDYPNIHSSSSSSASRPFPLHLFFSAAALRPPFSSDSLSYPPPSNHPFHSSSFNKRTRHDIHGCADLRLKRVIKNRESADRSRARKQAYTNELEHELASLREENARLRRQQEKLCLRALDRHAEKRTLLRTSSAPF